MKKNKLALAVALVAIVSAASLAALVHASLPASKVDYSYSDVKEIYNANGTYNTPILGTAFIKASDGKDVVIDFTSDVGLDTNTTIKGNGQTDTSDTSYASVQVEALITPVNVAH